MRDALHATLLVSGHHVQVVGELVPGVQMRTPTRSDLAELPVPVVEVTFELRLPSLEREDLELDPKWRAHLRARTVVAPGVAAIDLGLRVARSFITSR